MGYERVAARNEFESRGRSIVFHHGKKQILVVGVGESIYALDNRCPHEGYPLSKGTTDDGSCTLTCNWHNWKFKLGDGHCIVGDDNVRAYDVKVEDDAVWVDVSPPPRDEIVAGIMRGLEKGFRRRSYGQICREIARLHFAEEDPRIAVAKSVVWSHDRLEFGMTHAFAATADWLALHAETSVGDDLERALIPLAEAVDHMSHDALRQPEFAFLSEGRAFDPDAYLDAVERESDADACAMMLGAWESGASFTDVASVLAQGALAHYADFGHALIWVQKAEELSRALADRDVDRALMLTVARSQCYATREDLIPEFRAYAPALAALRAGTVPDGDAPDSPYGTNVENALRWTVAAQLTRTPLDVYDVLLRENARAFLHYDISFDSHVDRPVSQNASWLNLTHAITFANAVRVTCEAQPDLWPQGLLQMACFVGRNTPFVDRDQDVACWSVADVDAFASDVKDRLHDHGVPLPIYSSHVLKTSLAVFAEAAEATPETRELLLASLNRFLNSPIKAKHVQRLMHQGIALVARDHDA